MQSKKSFRFAAWTTFLAAAFTPLAAAQSLKLPYSLPEISPLAQYRYSPMTEGGLVPLTVIGSVRNPGLLYVPASSNLVDVLALSGGTLPSADLTAISVSSRTKANSPQLRVQPEIDLEKILSSPSEKTNVPGIGANDVVYVPERKPIIGTDATTVAAFVGAIASIVLSAVIIRGELRGN